MKRTFFIAALMLFAFSTVQAQTLDKVLEKHYEATGHKKMADVKSYFIKAKISMMGQEMPMTMYIKKPDMFKTEMDMMGQKIVTAYDGKQGWMINPMMGSGVQNLEGDQLKQAMSQADMEGELYNYKSKGHQAELIGKVNQDGNDVYRIKFTDKDGQVKNYFIDASTYLVSSVKATVESMGQSVDVDTKMTEYQEIEGIKMAKKIEVTMPMGTQTILMEEIKFNQNIDNSVFARPAE
jgi:outer membrane lipoprotein-sorting protein